MYLQKILWLVIFTCHEILLQTTSQKSGTFLFEPIPDCDMWVGTVRIKVEKTHNKMGWKWGATYWKRGIEGKNDASCQNNK